METNEKSREQDGAADEQAQKKLTTSVRTPLTRPEKPSRRKLFGRRDKSVAGS